MTLVDSNGSEFSLRADRPEAIEQAHSRVVSRSTGGLFVVEGDGGWDPATLTLRVRVARVAGGPPLVEYWQALLAFARRTTTLRLFDDAEGGGDVAVHGLASAESVPRGAWVDVTLRFLPVSFTGPGPLWPADPEVPPGEEELAYLMASDTEYLAAGDDLALVWE